MKLLALTGADRLKPGLHTILLLSWVCCASCSQAADATAAFDSANKFYEQGKFAEAASAYETLARSNGASAALYFNLGNAFFKSGQMGRALAAYQQAEMITPRDPDVRANLQFTRKQAQGPTLAASFAQRWLGKLSLNEWTVFTAVAIWLWLLLLALLQWRPALKRPMRGWVIVLGIGALFLSGCLATLLYENSLARVAIVIARDAAVRNGPLEESSSAFTVHDGAELAVLDQKGDWLQVSADGRRVGWLRRSETVPAPPG
jgi:tetratricopeptide (TPR) repeat protein